ncbi:MAG: hypothetical protein OEW39_06310 [Deltaproteobacteria bacterium]|nr:hypothetical protein [Deltaproteobacteria bacterium]
MAVEGRYFTWTLAAGQALDDLTAGTGHLHKAVAIGTGLIAANGREAGGLLQYGGRAGEHVTLGYAGVMKFTAGAPVAAGRRLTVAVSGYLTEATSGAYIVGRCLNAAVASGAVGTGAFNFATIAYMGHSGEIA